jgi:DNA-binding transcriptional LysR family regulator
MNYRQLDIFRTVMRSGSASRAAELLDISQPAVSRTIFDLERIVGFNLFERIKGRLVPTPEAQMFLLQVDRSFVGLDRLRAEAARIRDFGAGTIRIASLAALGSTLVPRAIKAFQTKHPGIAVTLQIVSSSNVRELVVERGFDIGLAADEVDLSGVEHAKFASTRAICVMPAGHPLAELETITPRNLAGVPFIALAPEDRARHRIDAALDRAGVTPKVVVETPNSATICALALQGVGVGLTNPAASEGYAEQGAVFRPFEPAVYFNSILMFRPDMQKARLVKAFAAELLAARLSRSQPRP